MREKTNFCYYKLAGKPKERGKWTSGRKGKTNFKITSEHCCLWKQITVNCTSRTGRNFPTDKLKQTVCKMTSRKKILCLLRLSAPKWTCYNHWSTKDKQWKDNRGQKRPWEGGRQGAREREKERENENMKVNNSNQNSWKLVPQCSHTLPAISVYPVPHGFLETKSLGQFCYMFVSIYPLLLCIMAILVQVSSLLLHYKCCALKAWQQNKFRFLFYNSFLIPLQRQMESTELENIF